MSTGKSRIEALSILVPLGRCTGLSIEICQDLDSGALGGTLEERAALSRRLLIAGNMLVTAAMALCAPMEEGKAAAEPGLASGEPGR